MGKRKSEIKNNKFKTLNMYKLSCVKWKLAAYPLDKRWRIHFYFIPSYFNLVPFFISFHFIFELIRNCSKLFEFAQLPKGLRNLFELTGFFCDKFLRNCLNLLKFIGLYSNVSEVIRIYLKLFELELFQFS